MLGPFHSTKCYWQAKIKVSVLTNLLTQMVPLKTTYLFQRLLSDRFLQTVALLWNSCTQDRKSNKNEWCNIVKKLRYLRFWTLCSLKVKHCQGGLLLVNGVNLRIKVHNYSSGINWFRCFKSWCYDGVEISCSPPFFATKHAQNQSINHRSIKSVPHSSEKRSKKWMCWRT